MSALYVDKGLSPDGVQKIELKAGVAGKAKILLTAKGDSFAMPTMPILILPVTVQLVNDQGVCWEAVYSSTLRNLPESFKAKSD